MPLPVPKLVVFYNGEDPREDEVTLRLSDAFKEEIRRNVSGRLAERGGGADSAAISDEAEFFWGRNPGHVRV